MSLFASRLRASARHSAAVCAGLTALAVLPGVAQASTCSTNGCIIDLTSTIYVDNNLWGSVPAGSWESITVNSSNSWRTDWHYTGSLDWKIHSYASAILGWQWGFRDANTGLPVSVTDSSKAINTTTAYTWSGGAAAGDIAYDLWYHSSNNPGTSTPSDECMIWLADWGGLGGGGGGTEGVIDGVDWDCTQVWNGSWNLLTFRKHGGGNYDVGGRTLNIQDFNAWLVSHGFLSSSHWADSVQFGTEVYNPGDGWLNLSNYTASVGAAGSCGTPAFTFSGSASPNPVSHTSSTTLTLNVKDTVNCVNNAVVDLEIYNSAGTKVGQYSWTGQNFTLNQTHTYTQAWTPGTAGTYTIRAGVFGAGWTPLYTWSNGVYNVTAN